MSVEAAVRFVFDRLQATFSSERCRDALGEWEHPSGAFLALAINLDQLEVGWIGDCACLHIRDDEVQRVGPSASARETETARAILAANPDFFSTPISPDVLDRVREGRGRTNRIAMTIDGREKIGMTVARIACRPGDVLVLMTDGFAALIDDYGWLLHDFVSVLRQQGLTGLATELRGIEEADVSGRRFPRLKISDDATALFVRISA